MAWDVYLALYAKMNEDNFISFDDFYKRKIPLKQEIKEKTEEEILSEVKGIIDTFNGGENY